MGKQLLFDTLKGQTTKRPPWVPFAGIHAGKLTNVNAIELLTNKDTLLKSLLEVHKLYKPDGQPIIFDLQVEAEILGCDLFWSTNTPPTVSSHPLQHHKEVPCLCKMPTKESGRLPLILDVMREMKQTVGEDTALYGLICGPFTLASHLRGTTIFMDMFDDPDFVKNLIHFSGEVAKTMAKLYIEAGMDIIAVVDPLVSQISPKHFKEFMSDTFTDLFASIKSENAFSSFFVCGDATKNITAMCETSPDSISVDENIDIIKAKEITDQFNITIGGNIPLTTVMLHGSQLDNIKYAVDLLDQLDSFTHFILSPGCDMPYDTPIENTIGVSQAAHEFQQMKETVLDYQSTDYSKIDITLPDYNNLKKPLIETFTLDSDSCAACTYMWGLVTSVKDELQEDIDIVEYKFTSKESIARCIKMGIKNLPSVYINGELAYSSIIPTKQELINKIKTLL